MAQTNLSAKTTIASITAIALIVGLLGCGKSEAARAAEQQGLERHKAAEEKAVERKAAWQRFTEAIAAVKVRTQGSTYSEFRKAVLDLETSFEVNKSHLEDVRPEFAALSALMSATDYCWNYQTRNSDHLMLVPANDKAKLEAMKTITPGITNKLHFKWDQQQNDPDFSAGNYVKRGLTKINAWCEIMLESLTKKN